MLDTEVASKGKVNLRMNFSVKMEDCPCGGIGRGTAYFNKQGKRIEPYRCTNGDRLCQRGKTPGNSFYAVPTVCDKYGESEA